MQEIYSTLQIEPSVELINQASLPSCFAVSDLAAHSIASVGNALAELVVAQGLTSAPPTVQVDQELASLWFGFSIQAIDWQMPPIWDSIAGDYRTRDGWIKLHTNLPHHKQAALSVLGCAENRDSVALAVKTSDSTELEAAIMAAGGVAAALRSRAHWLQHPQMQAVAKEPLIHFSNRGRGQVSAWQGSLQRPLQGLKVLDLTRVLAGPVATRTLAGFGAQVLRIDPPGWEEANVVPDVTLGKRCARLKLDEQNDRAVFESLLSQADVLVHGYRPDALERLGYGDKQRKVIAPNLLDVALDAYGWSGPWAGRRGFDSLVQMSCGIASEGMSWAQRDLPTPLPVQALDHATGYLMAAAILRLLNNALSHGEVGSARLSLVRTAELLIANRQLHDGDFSGVPEQRHFAELEENTAWGRARRLRPALSVEGVAMHWDTPACDLGSDSAVWL